MLMKIQQYIALAILLLMPLTVAAQDTILNRNVTVERDFQPVISNAGIISVKPVIVQKEMEPVEVSYSSYSQSLSPAFNVNPLGCSLTSWEKPKPLHGYVRGGIGHTNTAFDFGYTRNDRRSKITLDTYAHHRAEWGRYTVEQSSIGLDITKAFTSAALYFGADAQNRFYTMSGRYVDAQGVMHLDKMSDLKSEDKLSLWDVNTRIGVRSSAKGSISYQLQTGYSAFLYASDVTEHQVRTFGRFEWNNGEHRAGINASVANFFLKVNDNSISSADYNPRHAIRIEPYYAFDRKRFHLHAGVNIDMNIGHGQMMSGSQNIAFAPSPNVKAEYDITRNWLAVYGEASGSYGEGSLQSYSTFYPYRPYADEIISHHACAYIPLQAQLGLKIRPQANLLIDVHARYELKKNQFSAASPYYWEVRQYRDANGNGTPLFGDFVYCDLQRWKIGAEITYHYQDIIRVFAAGAFYTGSMDNIELPAASQGKAAEEASFEAAVRNANGTYKMLDRPRWDITVNIDARINRHWSLYSHNYFAGKRQTLLWDETAAGRTYSMGILIPTVDMNLGCTYEYNKWLSVFLELNNFIHRHNAYYYGYSNPGINFLLGASYKF